MDESGRVKFGENLYKKFGSKVHIQLEEQMERIKKYEPLWEKWRVTRKLGEGGFGAVYEVECDKFDSKPCAVKIISSKNEDIYKRMPMGVTLSSNEFEKQKEKEVKRKEKELELMNRLQGEENIVTIYDGDVYEQEDGIDIIIRMELLENLVSYIQKKQISSDEEWRKLVIKIGIDICKALEICEQKRIVHRDIKPENIFVNKKGTFKLGDFGISRELSKSASRSLKSQAGTELYMSPEAFDVLSKVDIRTDIYSLGITMYQCLNDGMPPFWKDGDYDARENAIRTRLSGTAIPIPEKGNGQLWKIVQKACQFNRENRYQHASEMRRDLEKLKKEGKAEEQKEEQKQNNDLNNEKILKELSRMREELERLKAEKSEIQNNNIKFEKVVEKQYKVGDTVSFGRYPQDEDGGVKPIEWTVMKKEENKVLLLSKYVLDAQPYNKKFEEVTWETSDIRRWLNSDFYTTAFNDIEQRKIADILVRTENNPEYGTAGGNDTEDKVFLLGIEEAERLFINDAERRTTVTKYAEKAGVFMGNEGYPWWWLRSPGSSRSDCAAIVHSRGWVHKDGFYVYFSVGGVRPALWLNL